MQIALYPLEARLARFLLNEALAAGADRFRLRLNQSEVSMILGASRQRVNRALVALQEGDVRRLQGIPGIGRKTAERLVVELKDRVRDLARAAKAKESSSAIEIIDELTGEYPDVEAADQKTIRKAIEGVFKSRKDMGDDVDSMFIAAAAALSVMAESVNVTDAP